MDRILLGLLASDKPDALKKSFIDSIVSTSSQAHQVQDILNMLNSTMKYILNSPTNNTMSVNGCKNIYRAWATQNVSSLEAFVKPELVCQLLDEKVPQPANAVFVVHESIKLSRNTSHFPVLCGLVEVWHSSIALVYYFHVI